MDCQDGLLLFTSTRLVRSGLRQEPSSLNERLVIEYISAQIISFSACTKAVATLKTTAGGVEEEHPLYLQLIGTLGTQH
jgi:hypothetical protein